MLWPKKIINQIGAVSMKIETFFMANNYLFIFWKAIEIPFLKVGPAFCFNKSRKSFWFPLQSGLDWAGLLFFVKENVFASTTIDVVIQLTVKVFTSL